MPSDKIDKKRKRHSDRHERPSKKPALDLLSLPPLAASVVEDQSELAPVIVTTPGLETPKNISLTPYLKPRQQQPPSRSTNDNNANKGIANTELLLQTSSHPKLDFVGREGGDDADSQLMHYIAVIDPEKQTWQFVEARKVTLRGAVRKMKTVDEEGEEVESSEDEEVTNMRAQKTALTQTFGTKQSKKLAQSMAENAQLASAPSAEPALLSSMPTSEQTDLQSKSAAVQAQVQAAKPLPTANLLATHPVDVYPLDVLVAGGVGTLRQLPGVSGWQEAVGSGRAVSTTSRFVSRRVEAVVKSGNTTQVQVLRYIFLLLEFARSLRGAGRKESAAGPGSKRLPSREDLRRILSSATGNTSAKAAASESGTETHLPDPIVDALRRKHAPNGSTLTKNDLTLLHTTICALTLHIPPQPAKDGGSSTLGGNSANELATDPADLRDDLRLDNNVILQYFRELGCRVDKPRESEFAKWGVKGGKAEAAARRVARLRVPVEFPKVSRGGRK